MNLLQILSTIHLMILLYASSVSESRVLQARRFAPVPVPKKFARHRSAPRYSVLITGIKLLLKNLMIQFQEQTGVLALLW